MSITGYDDAYAEFVLYNWDKEPWLIYQDFPSFPHPGASGSAILPENRPGTCAGQSFHTLNKGAAKYLAYFFANDTDKIQSSGNLTSRRPLRIPRSIDRL